MILDALETAKKKKDKEDRKIQIERKAVEEQAKRFASYPNPPFKPQGVVKQSWASEVAERKKSDTAKKDPEKIVQVKPDNVAKQANPIDRNPSAFMTTPSARQSLFTASSPEAPANTLPKIEIVEKSKDERSAIMEKEISLMIQEIQDMKDMIDSQKASPGEPTRTIVSGLPSGTLEYQVLRWYDDTKDWIPDWVRAH